MYTDFTKMMQVGRPTLTSIILSSTGNIQILCKTMLLGAGGSCTFTSLKYCVHTYVATYVLELRERIGVATNKASL